MTTSDSDGGAGNGTGLGVLNRTPEWVALGWACDRILGGTIDLTTGAIDVRDEHDPITATPLNAVA